MQNRVEGEMAWAIGNGTLRLGNFQAWLDYGGVHKVKLSTCTLVLNDKVYKRRNKLFRVALALDYCTPAKLDSF